jgi:ankyrin repeat protein
VRLIHRALSNALILVVVVMSTNINAGSTQGDIAAYLDAVRRGDLDKVQRYVDQGIIVDARDVRDRTALLLATHENHIAIAELLIRSGADVNARDDINDSPYLYAGAEGRLDILHMTVTAGADLTSVNRYGGTALIPAAHHGHVETVKYLLTTETDIDHVNFLGWTALLEAVILGDGGAAHQSIVELLLSAGANPHIADKEGVTALEHARQMEQTAVIRLLEQNTE